MSPTLLTAICMAHEMHGLCPEPRDSDSTLRLTKGDLELSEWPSDHHGSRCFGFRIHRLGRRDWQMSYQMHPKETVAHALNRLVSTVRTFTRGDAA